MFLVFNRNITYIWHIIGVLKYDPKSFIFKEMYNILFCSFLVYVQHDQSSLHNVANKIIESVHEHNDITSTTVYFS